MLHWPIIDIGQQLIIYPKCTVHGTWYMVHVSNIMVLPKSNVHGALVGVHAIMRDYKLPKK